MAKGKKPFRMATKAEIETIARGGVPDTVRRVIPAPAPAPAPEPEEVVDAWVEETEGGHALVVRVPFDAVGDISPSGKFWFHATTRGWKNSSVEFADGRKLRISLSAGAFGP